MIGKGGKNIAESDATDHVSGTRQEKEEEEEEEERKNKIVILKETRAYFIQRICFGIGPNSPGRTSCCQG